MTNKQKLHLINLFDVFSRNTLANEQLGFQYLKDFALTKNNRIFNFASL